MTSIRRQIFVFAACALLSVTCAAQAQAGDGNGDGRADILWRHATSGQVYYWQMNGPEITSSSSVATPSTLAWKIVGTGDYNGDNKADIMWRNSVSRQVYYWQMDGAVITSSSSVATPTDSHWQVIGSGDYDGDGNSDLMWRHMGVGGSGEIYFWRLNGSTIMSSALVARLTDLDWKAVGSGDYDGDTKDDLMWRHELTGQVYYWRMNGSTIMSSAAVARPSDLKWHVVGSGDYNGDTKDDLMLRNIGVGGSGKVYYWQMDGATITSSSRVSIVSDLNWTVVGDGDYNGDGNADMLWLHGTSGQIYYWQQDGHVTVDPSPVSTLTDLDWEVVGDGDEGGGTDPGPTLDERLQWSVPLPGQFSLVRPAVGPDGSVYAVDVNDNLIAVAANGALQWSASQAGNMGVDVGPDGTIYTGNEDWIKAYNPNGTLKWTFVQSPRAHAFHDVAVGPDGHVYGLASSGMGVFSLDDTASGPVLRWANPEPFVRLFVDYTELAFGPTSDGGDQQLYFHVNDNTRGIRLSDGASIFTLFGQNQRPKVSPFDGTWHVGDAAYTPDGALEWTFDFGLFATAREPALGQSGMHYAISQGQILFGIDSGGVGRWSTLLDEFVGLPDVDPAESMLLLPTSATMTHPSGLKSVRTSNGSPLWRMEIPPDTNGGDQHVNSGVAFSADGTTAYVMSATASGGLSRTTYLNAIAIDPAIPSASTQLRATNIDMSSKRKGQSLEFSGVVTVLDENRNAVTGAAVQATWTLPDNSTVSSVVTTNNSGDAKFTISGDGGLYWLSVTDISKSGYEFDPDHSILDAGIAGF